MKRQQAIGKISDPLVHNSNLTMTELLKTRIGKETDFPNEILFFSQWLVYLAFSTVKPNPSKNEGQALNDSYNQMFINIAGEAYETSEMRSQIDLVPYSTQYAQDLMNYFYVVTTVGDRQERAYSEDMIRRGVHGLVFATDALVFLRACERLRAYTIP